MVDESPLRRLVRAVMSHTGTYVLLCGAIILGDIFSGPHVLLTITFVIPVAFAAWYRGFRFALALAVALVVIRIPIAVLLKHATPLPYAIANAVIRIAVLGLMAKMVAAAGRRTKFLQQEVGVLEGMLPICSHCKRIRDAKNQWQPLESYISRHSDARFTHSICPECELKFFGHADPVVAQPLASALVS